MAIVMATRAGATPVGVARLRGTPLGGAPLVGDALPVVAHEAIGLRVWFRGQYLKGIPSGGLILDTPRGGMSS